MRSTTSTRAATTSAVVALVLRDPTRRADLLRRIAAKTRSLGKGACAEWTGLRSRGYPIVALAGFRRPVGALVLFLASGRYPTRVARTCGNRRCVETTHLVAI